MRAIAAIYDSKNQRKKNSASSYINTRVRYESIISAVHQIEQSTQLIVVCVRNPNIYFDFCIYITYLHINNCHPVTFSETTVQHTNPTMWTVLCVMTVAALVGPSCQRAPVSGRRARDIRSTDYIITNNFFISTIFCRFY